MPGSLRFTSSSLSITWVGTDRSSATVSGFRSTSARRAFVSLRGLGFGSPRPMGLLLMMISFEDPGLASAGGQFRPQQIADVQFEGASQRFHVVYGNVPFTSLNRADVGAVQTCQLGQAFLADAPRKALCFEQPCEAKPCGFGGATGV